MTQTIETQYKNLNNLASRLRQAGAVISVSKLKNDIFSINLKQLPKTSTVEKIVGIEEDGTSVEEIVGIEEDDTSVKESDSVKSSKQSSSKATKQSKTKATRQPKPKAEDFNIDTDTIPF